MTLVGKQNFSSLSYHNKSKEKLKIQLSTIFSEIQSKKRKSRIQFKISLCHS